MTTIQRAKPRTVGTHFAQATDDHACAAACYRVLAGGRYVSVLCDAGHSCGMHDTHSRTFGGSAAAASLNDLPVGAPFVIEFGAEAAA